MTARAYIWREGPKVWTEYATLDATGETIDLLAQRFVDETSIAAYTRDHHSFMVACGDLMREYLIQETPRAVQAL